MEKLIKFFCGEEFFVKGDGKEKIKEILEKTPNTKFVLTSSHFSNLDAPAAVAALGDVLDIQITAESGHFKSFASQNFLFKMVGKENFVPLSYEKGKKGRHGVFDPEDFYNLVDNIEDGKTPWVAIHPFTKEEEMVRAGIGAVYLAHKSGAMIIPAALEYAGGSVSLEGIGELAKAVNNRKTAKGIYHVGKPIQLLPLDVLIIESVMEKRAHDEEVTAEEVAEFSRVSDRLRQDAKTVASRIGMMLPPEQRGPYQEIEEIELEQEDIISEMSE